MSEEKEFDLGKTYREFKRDRREVLRELKPMFGSWKWYVCQWRHRDGQRIRSYLRDNIWVFPRVLRWGWQRFYYGVSLIDYSDFDDSLLTYIYNNLLALRKLSISAPGEYADNHKEWDRQLDGALTVLREHLLGPDAYNYPDMSLLFDWLGKNLWSLWD